jgi:hypothetical protein
MSTSVLYGRNEWKETLFFIVMVEHLSRTYDFHTTAVEKEKGSKTE